MPGDEGRYGDGLVAGQDGSGWDGTGWVETGRMETGRVETGRDETCIHTLAAHTLYFKSEGYISLPTVFGTLKLFVLLKYQSTCQ